MKGGVHARRDGAEILTPGRLRELTALSDGAGITHDSPEDRFAAAIAGFQQCLENLHMAARAVGAVTDQDGVPLVDTLGFENPDVKDTLAEIGDLVSEWRGARRRAVRMRADLDDGGETR